jgi:ABC-type nitrate/sulfonate/bicarbonate transport system substrate-binding protein
MRPETTSMKLNQLIWALLVFTGISICTGPAIAAPDKIAPKVTEFRIGYQPLASPGGALVEVIRRDRLFRKELQHKGIRLRLMPTNSGGEAARLIKEGALDASFAGDMPTIELALSTPVTIMGPIKRNYAAVVAQRGITPRELKGKRIGYVYATSGHYALLKTLQNGGLTEQDVTLVPVEISKMTEALLTGKIEAFAAWEPTPSSILSKYPDRYSVTGRQISTSYLVITKKLAAKHPENTFLLAAAVARAMHWMGQDISNLKKAVAWNQATINSLSGSSAAISVEDLQKQLLSDIQIMRHSKGFSSITDNGNRLLADEFDFLKKIGKLPKTAQWETVRKSFDNDLMDRIYRTPSASLIKRFDYDLN